MGVAHSLLLAALAALLIVAAVGDWRTRIIENWLNAVIALAAPLSWWTGHVALWPDAALLIAQAAIVFALFAGLFALGAMGGGDVKLIGALALWFPITPFLQLLIAMSLIGGVLTVFMIARQRVMKISGALEIPYGIAIALAGLWTIFRTIS